MSTAIPGALQVALSESIADKMGLSFPRERLNDLVKGLGRAAREFGFDDETACARWLVSSSPTRKQVEILARHLTVGETYFFRDAKTFEALEQEILPRLIDSRRESGRYLRIWSAGCATGEEPYSVAILLRKMIPDLKNWAVTVLATDINPHVLCKAETGVYGTWSFRETPAWVKTGYFKKTQEGKLALLPSVKSMVTFAYHNLALDNYPSLVTNTNALDIIFCRNTLMYFSPGTQKNVIRNLSRCLVEGGLLIVGPAEISNGLFPQFTAVNFSGATFYQKRPAAAVPETPPFAGTSKHFPLMMDHPGVPPPVAAFSGKTAEPAAPAEEKRARKHAPPDAYKEAASLFEQGRYDEAAEKIKTRLPGDQGDARAMALLARIYANKGRLSDALAWSEKAAAAGKMDPDAHYLFAIILAEHGRTDDAVRALKRSLYLDPAFILAHFELGNLMHRQNRPRDRARYFKNALSLLGRRKKEEVLAAFDGLTAGRLIEMIHSSLLRGGHHE